MRAPEQEPIGGREFVLSADSYESGILEGRLYHRRQAGGKAIRGVMSLLLGMEEILDTEGCPGMEASWETGPLAGRPGKAGTFRIEILFREGSSWQGRITWQENRTAATFRSALEFLLILNEALAE